MVDGVKQFEFFISYTGFNDNLRQVKEFETKFNIAKATLKDINERN